MPCNFQEKSIVPLRPCRTYVHNSLYQIQAVVERMPDLTIDLSDELHEHLVQVAKVEGTNAETLARQIITLEVGYNPSSRERPISTGFLERQTDDVLLVAEKEPVYFVDPVKREFVLVSNNQYEQLMTSEISEV